MNQSEQIDKLAEALAKAQGSFGAVVKDKVAQVRSEKGNYSYAYADLSSVIDAVRPALSANGLAYLQMITPGQPAILITRLIHSSGQWIESSYPFVMQGRAQEIGSALTYARRYSLTALVGVVAEDDDDGNAADGNKAETGKKPSSKPAQPPKSQSQGNAPQADDGRAKARAWLDKVLPKMKDVQSQQDLNRFTDNNREAIEKLQQVYPDLYAELEEALSHTVESFLSGG